MERYGNTGGDSGVVAYERGADFIRVQFSDGSIYLYTHAVTGSDNVEHMKQLASSGHGLNSFINTVVPKHMLRRSASSLPDLAPNGFMHVEPVEYILWG